MEVRLCNFAMARYLGEVDGVHSHQPDHAMDHFVPVEMIEEGIASESSDVFSWAMTAIQVRSG